MKQIILPLDASPRAGREIRCSFSLIDVVFDFAQPEYYKNTLTELGTEILNQIQQSVKAKFEGKLSVVLIGHSRIWIQTNLFYHQTFFKKIMIPV